MKKNKSRYRFVNLSLPAWCFMMTTMMFSACSTDTIDTWTEETALAWFPDDVPFNYTFVTEPEQTTQMVKMIDIQLATPVKNYPRKINIEVAQPLHNPQSRIEFVNPVTVEAGAQSAQLQVTFYRTPNLNNEVDTLVLRIIPSDDFQPGIIGLTEKAVVISNTFLRPEWWKGDTGNNLGEFCQTKLIVYYTVFGTVDFMFCDSLWSLQGQLATYKLNEYSKAHYGKEFRYLTDSDLPL